MHGLDSDEEDEEDGSSSKKKKKKPAAKKPAAKKPAAKKTVQSHHTINLGLATLGAIQRPNASLRFRLFESSNDLARPVPFFPEHSPSSQSLETSLKTPFSKPDENSQIIAALSVGS